MDGENGVWEGWRKKWVNGFGMMRTVMSAATNHQTPHSPKNKVKNSTKGAWRLEQLNDFRVG